MQNIIFIAYYNYNYVVENIKISTLRKTKKDVDNRVYRVYISVYTVDARR